MTKLNEGFKEKTQKYINMNPFKLQKCSIKVGSTILYKAQSLAVRFTTSADFPSCPQQRNKNKITL